MLLAGSYSTESLDHTRNATPNIQESNLDLLTNPNKKYIKEEFLDEDEWDINGQSKNNTANEQNLV